MPYDFEFKPQLFSHFSELKIRLRLKFEVLFFHLRSSRKGRFPRKTGGLAKTVVNFTYSEIYIYIYIYICLQKFSTFKFVDKLI
jgi:hypothetical protein